MDNEKSIRRSVEAAFSLHYFPEIPTRCDEEEDSEPEQSGFPTPRRNTFQKSDVLGNRDKHTQDAMEMEARKAEQMREMMDRAFQEGYAKGVEEGKAFEREKLTPCVQGIEKVFHDFENIKSLLAKEAETAVVKLALNIARKVMHTEPTVRPEVVLSIASAALGKVMDHNRITLRIHPDDMTLLEAHRRELQQIVGSKEPIRFEPDDDITSGGCFVETDFGDIDARIESQLEAIEDALMSEWAQAENGEE